MAECFNAFSPAGNGGLLLTVFIGHMDVPDARFIDKIGDVRGLAKHHHDFTRKLTGRRHHQIRAFDNQFHGIIKTKHTGTKKGSVFPYTVADIRIRLKSFFI